MNLAGLKAQDQQSFLLKILYFISIKCRVRLIEAITNVFVPQLWHGGFSQEEGQLNLGL